MNVVALFLRVDADLCRYRATFERLLPEVARRHPNTQALATVLVRELPTPPDVADLLAELLSQASRSLLEELLEQGTRKLRLEEARLRDAEVSWLVSNLSVHVGQLATPSIWERAFEDAKRRLSGSTAMSTYSRRFRRLSRFGPQAITELIAEALASAPGAALPTVLGAALAAEAEVGK